MAKAIVNITEKKFTPEELREQALARVSDALVEHEAGLTQWLELVDQLHQRGVFDAAIAILERGDSILQLLVDFAEQPNRVGGIKNLIAVAQGFSALDTQALTEALQGVAAGTKEMAHASAQSKPLGVFDLLKAIKDPDVSAGIAGGLALLKGLGASIRARTEPDTTRGN